MRISLVLFSLFFCLSAVAQTCTSERDQNAILDQSFDDPDFRQIACGGSGACSKGNFKEMLEISPLQVNRKKDFLLCLAKPKRKPKNYQIIVFASTKSSLEYQFSFFGADVNIATQTTNGKRELIGREIGSGGTTESEARFFWNGKKYVEKPTK